MAHFHIQDLTFSYPGANRPTLSGVNLTIEKGEYVVLCGKSGSGKTSLLRHLKSVLTPYGSRSGQVLFDFAGQGTYSFQSPAADKAWQLRMYRQVSSSADVAEVSSMRLVQQGNRVEIQGRADVRLVEVYDMQARRVACSTDGPRVTLPCRGVFLVRAEAEGESATWKVVFL